MKDPWIPIPNPFIIVYIHPEIRMIHYVTNHMFFPRKSNFSLITQVEVEGIWIIENKI